MYLSRGLSFTVAGNPSITSIIHVLNSYIYFFKINENNMPMGNITHLRHSSNQEIHLHKVIILLIHNHNVDWEKKKFISILKNGPYLQLESPFIQDALCQVLLKLLKWFWKRFKPYILSMYFLFFSYYLP